MNRIVQPIRIDILSSSSKTLRHASTWPTIPPAQRPSWQTVQISMRNRI